MNPKMHGMNDKWIPLQYIHLYFGNNKKIHNLFIIFVHYILLILLVPVRKKTPLCTSPITIKNVTKSKGKQIFL